jgi:Leucine-rich repeat (LRR) protein
MEMSGGRQRTLEEMRELVEKRNPFEILEGHDVFGNIFELTAGRHVALLRTSKSMNAAVHRAGKKVAVQYVVDTDKFNDSTDEGKAATMLNDLRSACKNHDVQDIRMCDLKQNGPIERESMLIPLGSILETCDGLRSLTLRNNQGLNVATLAAGLGHLTGLKRLDLSHNIGMALNRDTDWEFTALTQLNLWGNYLGDKGIERLTHCIDSCTGLTDLNLGSNGMNSEDGVETLTTFLARCPEFTRLDLSSNDLGSASMQRLATGLPALVSLVHLDLHGNNIMMSGLNALGLVLTKCVSLQCLKVWDNQISPPIPAETYDFTTALPLCPRLKKLDLSVNNLGVDFTGALVRVLPSCDALECLRLFDCGVTDESAKLLTINLIACDALRELDLRSNYITVEIHARLKRVWVYKQDRTMDLLLLV